MILHKAKPGEIYNVGGDNEISNVDVAKSLIKLLDLEEKEKELVTFVPDRKFNDLRYTINTGKLQKRVERRNGLGRGTGIDGRVVQKLH